MLIQNFSVKQNTSVKCLFAKNIHDLLFNIKIGEKPFDKINLSTQIEYVYKCICPPSAYISVSVRRVRI